MSILLTLTDDVEIVKNALKAAFVTFVGPHIVWNIFPSGTTLTFSSRPCNITVVVKVWIYSYLNVLQLLTQFNMATCKKVLTEYDIDTVSF